MTYSFVTNVILIERVVDICTRAGLSNVHSVHVHMKPHHQANIKIVMLKFVIEAWPKCIEVY